MMITNFNTFINESLNLLNMNDEDFEEEFEDLFFDNYSESDFNYHKTKSEIYEDVKLFINELRDFDNPITLFRIIQAKNENSVDLNKLGLHCKLIDIFDTQFLKDINIDISDVKNGKYNLYVFKFEVDKKYIDFLNTIKNNIKYPDEEEVTLLENSKYEIIDSYQYFDY